MEALLTWQFWITLVIGIFAYATIGFALGMLLRRNDIADIAWPFGFMLLGWILFFVYNGNQFALLINFVISLWSLRLIAHIGYRISKTPEDKRYQAWRKDFGKNYIWQSFLKIYFLQAILISVVAEPITLANLQAAEINIFSIIFLILALAGLIFEAIADWQLTIFKQKGKKGILQSGLWKYSRHPNYFGELLFWWSLTFACIAAGTSLIALLGPALLTFLILGISGITLQEKNKQNDPEFQHYKKTTSALIPWFKLKRK